MTCHPKLAMQKVAMRTCLRGLIGCGGEDLENVMVESSKEPPLSLTEGVLGAGGCTIELFMPASDDPSVSLFPAWEISEDTAFVCHETLRFDPDFASSMFISASTRLFHVPTKLLAFFWISEFYGCVNDS